MKDAKSFISLKDWKNAIEKLELEIKDSPKNLDAYKLLSTAQKGLYFDGYEKNNFLNPEKVKEKDFPNLIKDGSEQLFKTMERIEKIESNEVDPNDLFFKGLYHYFEWKTVLSKIDYDIEQLMGSFLTAKNGNETKLSKARALRQSLFKNRCENNLLRKSKTTFLKCSETTSNIADNAYFWWYFIQAHCDGALKVKDFVNNFRQKYKNSDLNYEIDLLEFRRELGVIVNSYKDKPDSSCISKPLELVTSFIKTHPNVQPENIKIGHLVVDHVVESNRELLDAVEVGFKYNYSNASGLIEYLRALSDSDTIKSIKISALQFIGDYYKNEGETTKEIEIWKRILNCDVDNVIKDRANDQIAKAYWENKQFMMAVVHYKKISELNDSQKFNLWKLYNKLGQIQEAQELREELGRSTNSLIKLLIDWESLKINEERRRSDLRKLKIKGLDAEFDTYSIKVRGYVVNNLPDTVSNVKVMARVSDKYGNNTKQSSDYIDLIYSGKETIFEISVYYGRDRPSSIKYGAWIDDFSKE